MADLLRVEWAQPTVCSDYRLKRFGDGRLMEQPDIAIGELSRKSGCNIETIRYYERIDLLPKPRRTRSRYRLYGAADVRRLFFIRRARQLGLTLSEVRALPGLAGPGSRSCAQVRGVAAKYVTDVRPTTA